MYGGINKGLSDMAKAKINRLERKKKTRTKIHGMLLERGSSHLPEEVMSEEERKVLQADIKQKNVSMTKSEKQARVFIIISAIIILIGIISMMY